jgi:hypothetical protein
MITLEKAKTMSTESIEFAMNDIMEAVACAMSINDFQARANVTKYMRELEALSMVFALRPLEK